MLDKIFRLFFVEKKQNKKPRCLTVVRESSLFSENNIIDKTPKKVISQNKEGLTCLSEYFMGIKGLNIKEREKAKSLTLYIQK